MASIRYRPFLNSDPPALAEIWHSHPPTRGLIQSTTPAVLERLVFSKPYFDRQGFIVAEEDGQAIGFVHAGFGCCDDGSALSTQCGATCMLMVAPHVDRAEIAVELLAQSENYLQRGGATTLYGGSTYPVDPFYQGLYGGSELSGVLASDAPWVQLFLDAGYREAERYSILQRKLTGFRPPVNRQQMQLRRRYNIESQQDPPEPDWWRACTYGQTDRTQFTLCPRDGTTASGSVTFWDMEPLASSWGIHAAGLIQLEIEPSLRRQGLATFLVGESLRQIGAVGVTLAEVHIMQSNEAALGLYKKLGFEQIDQGIMLRKDV